MTVDGYINALPAAQRNALLRLRALIKSHVPRGLHKSHELVCNAESIRPS